MNVLFVCRGNALRSIMAEAYARSLELPDTTIKSCGTIASENKVANAGTFQVTTEILEHHKLTHFLPADYGQDLTQELVDQATIVICMNQTVADEAKTEVMMPANAIVWDINDVDEGGRVTNTLDDRRRYSEEILRDIVAQVDQLLGGPAHG